mmetsp:Transcript_10641/g.25314  ORF Transcript_10641/g.25314 Transcript_10641/m.25314 type:complete len:552 (+) Transcript_10641:190-1845(+)
MARILKSHARIFAVLLIVNGASALLGLRGGVGGMRAPEMGMKKSPHRFPLVESFGVGIATDAARYKVYRSDITDAFTVQSIATTCFLFFACLAPAVAFGGLQAIATNNLMGATEYIVSTGVCGMLYAVFAAQPLTIIGSTGPILAFTSVLYQVARRYGLPFLPLYAWVGIWSSFFLFLCSLFSASNIVLLLTRFTDEIFSNLISLIFIYEALDKIFKNLTGSAPAGEALLYLVAALSTFSTSKILSDLRATRLFNKSTRTALANFGPTIAVVLGCLIVMAAANHWGFSLDTLQMPEHLTTTSGRPWLVPLGDLPVWARWATIFPALMVTVLLFLDHNITVRLVNSKHWRMKKQNGSHIDLLVVSVCTLCCSILGLPFLAGATVRSINHVRANAVWEAQDPKEGAPVAPKLVGIREQRVTNFAIHALIAASVLILRPVLSRVPLAVLMGLFLHLGTSALTGNQMWERIVEVLEDPELTPIMPWKDHVSIPKVQLFTLVQCVCLYGMFAVKNNATVGVLFPLIVALLGPIRWALEASGLFSAKELFALDADDE